jgi:ASC-1-like (ASCH) protein
MKGTGPFILFNMIHEMKLQPEPYRKIETGEKVWEIRLSDEKRQKIKVDDVIVFTNANDGRKLDVRVTGLAGASSFIELFSMVSPTEAGWPTGTTPGRAAVDMLGYYSEADERRWGVMAIGIKLLGGP